MAYYIFVCLNFIIQYSWDMKEIIYILLIFINFTLSAQTNGGVYKEKKYPNGNLMYKGYFKDNMPVGEFLRYYPTGKIKVKMHYYSEFVMVSLYNEKSLLIAEGRYVEKQKDSTWTYYKDNKLVGKEEYTSGLLDGEVKKFFSNGNIAEIQEYKEGMKDGQWKRYYREGKLMCSCKYIKGKLNGLFFAYTPLGVRDIEGTFRNNVREGIWNYYDKNGSLRFSIEYECGMPTDIEQLEKMNKEDGFLYKKGENHFIDPENFMDSPEEYIIKSRKAENN